MIGPTTLMLRFMPVHTLVDEIPRVFVGVHAGLFDCAVVGALEELGWISQDLAAWCGRG